ncbi:MAG: exodeoxyribonuclease V subunit alpha [Desulfosarcinaceae bacterium]|nr:exodeoxyribonuclease V subunit alpha [Desulfosarcinaceae bacterium]
MPKHIAQPSGSFPRGFGAPTSALELLRPICGSLLDTLTPLLAQLPLSALDTLTMGDLLALSGHTRDPHLLMLLAWLFSALNEGSVCLKLTPEQLLRYHSPDRENEVRRHLEGFCNNLRLGTYRGLVARPGADRRAPLIRVSVGEGRHLTDLLYFQRFFRHERRLKARLEAFLDQVERPICAPDQIESLITDLWRPERVIRLGKDRHPLIADPQQRAALRLILTRCFVVVSGGPGTGKTSLLVNMLRLLAACGLGAEQICLTAPTGRAAQRMREAIQTYLASIAALTAAERPLLELSANTLHRLLRYRPHQQRYLYGADLPLPQRVVIVDEVSMIDVAMLDYLFQAADPGRTRLILLGDKDQLPSVQAGAVFAEMVPRDDPAAALPAETEATRQFHPLQGSLVILETSYRSGRKLARLAQAFNAGRQPMVARCSMNQALTLPPDNCALIESQARSGAASMLTPILTSWADHFYASPVDGAEAAYLDTAAALNGATAEAVTEGKLSEKLFQLFSQMDRARILTMARRGPSGSRAVNRLVVNYLVGRYGLVTDPATGLFNGAPLLITRNDHLRQLFNGDVGVALTDDRGNPRIFVQRGKAFISAPIQTLSDWEPAFATTVHKSQGSEYADVLLVFPGDPRHRLLCREIVYTGVTRARERLFLLARPGELQAALAHRIERSSGVMFST